MRKVVIWGIGDDYEAIHNQVQFEKLKGNIEVVALVAKKEDIYMSTLDGSKVITKEGLSEIEYDYLIVASRNYFSEIKKEAMSIGIEEEIIINGMAFLIQNFDFQRYVNLIENPITILSDDCWGGLIYKALYLPASTPMINVWFNKEDFLKLVADISYYMQAKVHMLQEGDLRNSKYPIGAIGDGENQIKIMFAHERNFEAGVHNWNRRKNRINFENIFVKMAMNGCEPDAEDKLQKFDAILYKKICFYPGETTIDNVKYLKRFEVHNIIGKNRDLTDQIMFNAYCRNYTEMIRCVDILKLLNGEDDFMREN